MPGLLGDTRVYVSGGAEGQRGRDQGGAGLFVLFIRLIVRRADCLEVGGR